MTSVRELVKATQKELHEPNLLPNRAAVMLNQTTALIGNVNDELRAAEMQYKHVLLTCLRANDKANRARIEAETSPEYARWQEARHVKELTVEMVRSLKAFLRIAEEEMRLTR